MRKILIILAIILLIVGIVLYLASFRSKNKSAATQLTNTPAAFTNSANNTTPAVKIDPFLQEKDNLTTLAKMFIERYGTWSNQSDFSNFTDLYSYMTDGLKTETQNFVLAQQTALKTTSTYYGLTTRVLSLSLANIVTDTSAEFTANVQQQETKINQTAALSKKVTLDFLKQGADWRVNQISFK